MATTHAKHRNFQALVERSLRKRRRDVAKDGRFLVRNGVAQSNIIATGFRNSGFNDFAMVSVTSTDVACTSNHCTALANRILRSIAPQTQFVEPSDALS